MSSHRWRHARGASIVLNIVTLSALAVVTLGPSADAVTPPVAEVYVANFSGAAVSQYGVNSAAAITPLPYPAAPSGVKPSHIIVSPNGKYAYALDCQLARLYQYTVDTAGLLIGSLVPMSPAYLSFGGCNVTLASATGHSLAENKTGTFVFVSGVLGPFNNQLLAYKVGSTGALTFAHFTDELTTDTTSVAIAPTGKFAYVSTYNGILFTYKVDTAGNLTAGPFTSIPGACLSDVAIAPSGKLLYVTDRCTNNLRVYTVNTTTGVIASSQIRATGASPSAVVASPNGKGVYVTNSGGNSVAQYVVSTTGLVTASSPAFWATCGGPVDLAIAKSGKSLYVTCAASSSVYGFNVSTTTQLLSPKPTPVVAAGTQPWGIATRN